MLAAAHAVCADAASYPPSRLIEARPKWRASPSPSSGGTNGGFRVPVDGAGRPSFAMCVRGLDVSASSNEVKCREMHFTPQTASCAVLMVPSFHFHGALSTATGPTISTGSMHIQPAAHATCCERVPVDGGKERVRLHGGAAAGAAAQPIARILQQQRAHQVLHRTRHQSNCLPVSCRWAFGSENCTPSTRRPHRNR